MFTLSVFLSLLLFSFPTQSLNNGVGKTPGLGWNSDYCLNCVSYNPITMKHELQGYQNEEFIAHIGQFMNTSGMQALGYRYVNMDAGWDLFNRTAEGILQYDPTLFPSGFNKTVNYIHSLNLGIGVYGDRGTLDCSMRPGNLNHEIEDALYYASLEIDWYKSDSCYASADPATAIQEYSTMRDALNKTNRTIWFALCGWEPFYALQGGNISNSWRIGVDTGGGWSKVMANVNNMLNIGQYPGQTENGGVWADMCLLLLPGMGSGADFMTPERHRSQFNMHCIFAANMLTTGNLSSIDPYAFETWTNPEAVAVNQDPHYVPFVVVPIDNVTIINEGLYDNATPVSYTYASVAECGGEPTYQQWIFNYPMTEFLYNNASTQCLNVDNCQTDIIYDGCTTTGNTCSGKNSYLNEQWVLTAEGALQTMLPSHLCATALSTGQVILSPCMTPLAKNQTWTYNDNQLQQNGLCLTASSPTPPPPDNSNVLMISRLLSDNTTGIAILNNHIQNITVTCDIKCFTSMNLYNTIITIRDLWLHENITIINTTLGYNFTNIGGNGSSILYKLYPMGPSN